MEGDTEGTEGGGYSGGFTDGGVSLGSANEGAGPTGLGGWGADSLGSLGPDTLGAVDGLGSSSFGLAESMGLQGPSFGTTEGFGNLNLADVDFSNMASYLDSTPSIGSISEGYGLGPSFAEGFGLQDAFGVPNEEDAFGVFTQNLKNFAKNAALQSLVAKAGLPSQTLGLLGIAAKGAKNDNAGVGKGFANMGLGMLGNMLGGPIGGLAASAIGNAMGLGSSLGGVTANQGVNGMNGLQDTGTMGGLSPSDIAGGLAGLYMGKRANNLYKRGMGDLAGIYTPGGAYAQNLRQQLERRDAAAGRRSQYGPREAQLMGMLADSQARALSSPAYSNMMQARERTQNQGLNTLLALMSKSGALDRGVNSIADLFRNTGQGGGSLNQVDFSDMPNYFESTPSIGNIPYDTSIWDNANLFGG